jgi:hypothetical protein
MRIIMLSLLNLMLIADQSAVPKLAPTELEQAIQVGSSVVASQIGARLHDGNPFSMWYQTRFGLTLHTPSTWIQYLASRAAFDGNPLKASDVSEDDRAKFLRVFVRPHRLVRHVALVTANDRLPLQAAAVKPCGRLIWFSATGAGNVDNNCTEYRFDWSEVLRRTDSGRREFDVAVTAVAGQIATPGSAREFRKNFRIKLDHLKRLVW